MLSRQVTVSIHRALADSGHCPVRANDWLDTAFLFSTVQQPVPFCVTSAWLRELELKTQRLGQAIGFEQTTNIDNRRFLRQAIEAMTGPTKHTTALACHVSAIAAKHSADPL